MGGAKLVTSLLSGLTVAQCGDGLAAAVCGRMFADLGARVMCTGADLSTPLAAYLNVGKQIADAEALSGAALIVCQDGPGLVSIRQRNTNAPVVQIAPFGHDGPAAGDPATDLTLLYASGIARLLTGQVDDLAEAPIRPAGEQSAFIGGLAAACAGMLAVLAPEPGAVIDVSIQEALALLAATELARAGLTGRRGSRKRLTDGNGATVCILRASDGYVAISPREEKQWRAWLQVMGEPEWGGDSRFASKPDRVANWDALHALMSAWSRQHAKQWIADAAQAAHVPSFPLRDLAEHLTSPQLLHRGFWRHAQVGNETIAMPAAPFGMTLRPGNGRAAESVATSVAAWPSGAVAGQATAASGSVSPDGQLPAPPEPGTLPLTGLRVLDFSWVIAGPTATRYLAAMGAEVIKVEAPGAGDPGRATELHTVLGQAKKAIVLDLKRPDHREAALALAKTSDVLVENFATGVMDRLGLGAEALRAVNPNLIYVSASGMGRGGPEAHAVAYGTLLQCYAGFAGLNRHPNVPPRVGFAWLDPMLGLMLAFAAAAALWRRREIGEVARIDCSMIEAILWTLSAPLLGMQTGQPAEPIGNRSDRLSPHGAWRCSGDDAWISIAARHDGDWRALCGVVTGLAPLAACDFGQRVEHATAIDAALAAWCRDRDASDAAAMLRRAGVPASELASSSGLVVSEHLRQRGFWDPHGSGVLPALPWRASFGRATGPAPELGADTDAVLRELTVGRWQ
jgi:crotonobetainyl-CoA:carnitine CoA-transferase CaiB-like acyl-CoA transferase